MAQKASLGRPMGPQRALLSPPLEHLIFIAFFDGFLGAPRAPGDVVGSREDETSGDLVKHHLGTHNGEIPMGK